MPPDEVPDFDALELVSELEPDSLPFLCDFEDFIWPGDPVGAGVAICAIDVPVLGLDCCALTN